jgi:hypothetical protein
MTSRNTGCHVAVLLLLSSLVQNVGAGFTSGMTSLRTPNREFLPRLRRALRLQHAELIDYAAGDVLNDNRTDSIAALGVVGPGRSVKNYTDPGNAYLFVFQRSDEELQKRKKILIGHARRGSVRVGDFNRDGRVEIFVDVSGQANQAAMLQLTQHSARTLYRLHGGRATVDLAETNVHGPADIVEHWCTWHLGNERIMNEGHVLAKRVFRWNGHVYTISSTEPDIAEERKLTVEELHKVPGARQILGDK